jgi:hypothetical protein
MTVVRSAKGKGSRSLPYLAPAGGNSGAEGGANEKVVVKIPDCCLARASIVKKIVRLSVSVKIGGRAYDDS